MAGLRKSRRRLDSLLPALHGTQTMTIPADEALQIEAEIIAATVWAEHTGGQRRWATVSPEAKAVLLECALTGLRCGCLYARNPTR